VKLNLTMPRKKKDNAAISKKEQQEKKKKETSKTAISPKKEFLNNDLSSKELMKLMIDAQDDAYQTPKKLTPKKNVISTVQSAERVLQKVAQPDKSLESPILSPRTVKTYSHKTPTTERKPEEFVSFDELSRSKLVSQRGEFPSPTTTDEDEIVIGKFLSPSVGEKSAEKRKKRRISDEGTSRKEPKKLEFDEQPKVLLSIHLLA
jgi:hypothetical protein